MCFKTRRASTRDYTVIILSFNQRVYWWLSRTFIFSFFPYECMMKRWYFRYFSNLMDLSYFPFLSTLPVLWLKNPLEMLLLLENCVKLFKVNCFIVERVNDKSSFIEMSYDRTTEKWYISIYFTSWVSIHRLWNI